MAQSSQLNLKTAISLIEEVSAQIEPFKQMIDQINQSASTGSEDGFMAVSKGVWEDFKKAGDLEIRKHGLLQKCDQAIQLAVNVKSSDPQATVTQQWEGSEVAITPEMVIGHAHLSKGVIHLISSNFVAARQSLQQSIKTFPAAEAQLCLGYASIGEGNRDDAIKQFQKVIDDYSESEKAVEANKIILELQRFKLKNWTVALVLSIFLGCYGIDRFYLGYIKEGFIKFFTVGGFCVWWIIDIIRIATNNLPDANGFNLEKANKQTAIVRR